MFEIAVIVEPRLHKYLKPVIDNMLRNINDNICIQVFHSKINEQFLRNNYEKLINDNKIILIFQTDSCVVRHMNTFDFRPYLDYGFIGAPCRRPPWQNGGFSIRKKSLALKAIESSKIKITYNEDKFFSYINNNICKTSTYELGNAFSVEQYYNENPFGLHKAWKYLSKENWQTLKNKFPEINLTFGDF